MSEDFMNNLDELQRYANLLDQGVITQAEFAQHRARLLAPLHAHPPATSEDPAMRLVLPVGRTGLAIAAGYLGLFSVIPLVGPIAVGISIWAILDLKARPKLSGRGRAYFGLIAGGFFTLLYAVALLRTR
jgi:hypothetical protein